MAQLVVRNLDEDVKARLKQRAEAHGQSMEEEVRMILTEAALVPRADQPGLGTRIAARFKGIGLKEGELPTIAWQPPSIPQFD